MSTLYEIDPGIKFLDTSEVLKRYLTHEYLNILLPKFVEYYERELPLWRVLNFYGINTVDGNTDQAYVHCKLLSHGSHDSKPSASYYRVDNVTGKVRPAFFCYKCGKLLTSFWFLYTMERDFHGLKIPQLFLFIENTFGIRFPVDILGSFDMEVWVASGGDLDKSAKKVNFKELLPYLDYVRSLKSVDPSLFFEKSSEVWKPKKIAESTPSSEVSI